MRKLYLFYIVLLVPFASIGQQVKILFDCTKAETAGNADWVIDADLHNISWGSNDQIGTGTASNPQRYPTPLQSKVTASTAETYWEGALSSWGIDCVNYGYEVETLPPTGLITYGDTSNPQDLSNYKVYVVDEPNIRFTQTEKNAMLNFVANGGGLFMISDHNNSDRNNDGWDSPNIWNDFLNSVTPVNPFGIKFDLDYFSPATTNVSTNANDSLTRGPYGNVTALTYSGATIIHIFPDTNSTATGDIWMNGVSQTSHDSIMFAHSHYGRGKVAAIADSSPLDDGTGNPNCTLYSAYSTADNGSDRKLLMNAIIWLAESPSVVVTDSLHLLTTADTTLCKGNSITMTAAGATTYSWQPGGATSASITVQPSASGLYIVIGTTGGISKKDTVHITVDSFASSAPQISAGGPTTFCSGGSVTLTAPTETAYDWSTGSTQKSITATQSGAYTATVTDANGCKAATNTLTVTDDTLSLTQPLIIAGGPLTFCSGGSVLLTAPAGYTYHWNGGSTQQSITATQSGSYFATVTDGNSCFTTTNIVTVTDDTLSLTHPLITAGGPLTFCTGGSVLLTAPAGYTYKWNNNSTQQSITATQSGSYFATVSDGNNCHATTNTITVTDDTLSLTHPVITASGPLTFCSGSDVALTAPAGYTYHWNGGSTQQSITATQSGLYFATVTDGNSCHTTTNTVTVTNDTFSRTRPQITANGPLTFCSGSNVILSAPAGYIYQWDNSTTQQSITVTQTGSFYATVTDGNSCHAQSDTVSVSVSANNFTGVTITPAGSQTVCAGDSIVLSAASGYTSYLWNTGAAQQNIKVAQSGNYYLTVSTGGNCHGLSDTVSISIDNFSATTPQINAGGPLAFCQGDSVTLSATGGGSYLWSTNAQQSSITVSQSGTYTVTVTDPSHCSAASQSTTVTVHTLPQVTFQPGVDSACSNSGPLLLSGSPTGGVFSGTGVSGSQFQPSVANVGENNVTYNYTDGNGCSNAETAQITVYICTGIGSISTSSVTIYPNPSSGDFMVQSSPGFEPDDIRVYDATGRQVRDITGHTSGSGLTVIDMKGFANGIYVAELNQNNNVIRVKLLKTE